MAESTATLVARELTVLAERSDGTARDAICEWAYEPERYPTLCAQVRNGIESPATVAVSAAALRQNARTQYGQRIAKLARFTG